MTNCRWQIWSVSSRVAALFHHHSRCYYWALFVRRFADHIVHALRSCTIFMNVKICTCDLLFRFFFQHSKMIFRAGLKVNILLLQWLKMCAVHCPVTAFFMYYFIAFVFTMCVSVSKTEDVMAPSTLYNIVQPEHKCSTIKGIVCKQLRQETMQQRCLLIKLYLVSNQAN